MHFPLKSEDGKSIPDLQGIPANPEPSPLLNPAKCSIRPNRR
jgi:hypothetical protein